MVGLEGAYLTLAYTSSKISNEPLPCFSMIERRAARLSIVEAARLQEKSRDKSKSKKDTLGGLAQTDTQKCRGRKYLSPASKQGVFKH